MSGRGGQLPSGTVTFLFTDIEGSTRLLQQIGEERYRPILARHHELLANAISRHGGVVVNTEGDGVFAAFARAGDAIRASFEAQLELGREAWPDQIRLRVRMGLHTGPAQPTGSDYASLAVHQAARVASAGHGGQVLISSATAQLVSAELPEDTALHRLGTYRLKDFDDPQLLFQLSHPGLGADFPALHAPAMSAHNVPVARTSFVGRDEEAAHLADLLSEHPVVTVVGVGGIGKSRLATRVATESMSRFRDGLIVVELGSLSDPELVPQTVASALGVREDRSRPLGDVVCDHLADRNVLVVLDNCEHLLDATAPLVAQIAESAPDVAVLATSRERLGVAGEQVYAVPPLALPPSGEIPAEEMLAVESVRLFVERAALADSAFGLTPDNAPVIADICRRLDGIPLAIELAAARTRSLSPAELADRLNDRFRLLTGGERAALPRQRTLQALMDWSYELLDDRERDLLERLSVFAGSFSLELVELACAGDGIDVLDILDLVGSLVDKSLLGVQKQEARTRYRMLETIRDYASLKLRESGGEERWRDRELAALIEITAGVTGASSTLGERRAEWLMTVEADEANIRDALSWGLDARRFDDALRLCQHVWVFWWDRGRWEEGKARMRAALSGSPEAGALRGWALYGLGLLMLSQEDPDAAAVYDEMEALAIALGDTEMLASARHGRADAYDIAGQVDAARASYESVLALADQLGDDFHRAVINRSLALLAIQQGRLDDAIAGLEDSLTFFRQGGHRFEVCRSLDELGGVLLEADRPREALAAMREGLLLAHELTVDSLVLDLLAKLASAFAAVDDLERALILLGAADALERELSLPVAREHRETVERLAGARLASGRVDELRAAGARMPMADAIALARTAPGEELSVDG